MFVLGKPAIKTESDSGLPAETVETEQRGSKQQDFYDSDFVGGGLYGGGVRDPNITLRFLMIVFTGIVAFGSVLFWRSQLFLTAEYQEMPITSQQLKTKRQNQIIRQMTMEKNKLDDELSR